MKRFALTEDHIELLEHVNIRWSDAEYGAPGVDEKRPFGNSGSISIEREICEYLGLEPVATDHAGRDVYDDEEKQEALNTYADLDTALRIVLQCQTFETGVFELVDRGDWRRVKVEHDDDCPHRGERVPLAIQGAYGRYICPGCGMRYRIS